MKEKGDSDENIFFFDDEYGTNKGYRFFHEDYVKLKMMDFMVHKDVLGEMIKEFKNDSK